MCVDASRVQDEGITASVSSRIAVVETQLAELTALIQQQQRLHAHAHNE